MLNRDRPRVEWQRQMFVCQENTAGTMWSSMNTLDRRIVKESRRRCLPLLMTLAFAAANACAADKAASEWVYAGSDGKLVYKKTPAGDRIMDFSHAGYMGGGVALPNVPVKRTVKPSGGEDDTAAIQEAIDEVAAMPLENGFRGAVLLAPGMFTCSTHDHTSRPAASCCAAAAAGRQRDEDHDQADRQAAPGASRSEPPVREAASGSIVDRRWDARIRAGGNDHRRRLRPVGGDDVHRRRCRTGLPSATRSPSAGR